jgi:hypothetical protein
MAGRIWAGSAGRNIPVDDRASRGAGPRTCVCERGHVRACVSCGGGIARARAVACGCVTLGGEVKASGCERGTQRTLKLPKTALEPTFHWEKGLESLFRGYRVLWKEEHSRRCSFVQSRGVNANVRFWPEADIALRVSSQAYARAHDLPRMGQDFFGTEERHRRHHASRQRRGGKPSACSQASCRRTRKFHGFRANLLRRPASIASGAPARGRGRTSQRPPRALGQAAGAACAGVQRGKRLARWISFRRLHDPCAHPSGAVRRAAASCTSRNIAIARRRTAHDRRTLVARRGRRLRRDSDLRRPGEHLP